MKAVKQFQGIGACLGLLFNFYLLNVCDSGVKNIAVATFPSLTLKRNGIVWAWKKTQQGYIKLHNCKKNQRPHYRLVAFDANTQESLPIELIL